MEHYVNLNTHSNYTAYETVMTPEDIVGFAIKEGAVAVALTDKDSVQGFTDFSRAAAKHKGFKPIYGVQIYCLMGEYNPVLITLLAKNQTGLRNMYKIITAGYMKLQETSQWPCVSRQDVEDNREGLFVGMDLRWADVYSLANSADADVSAIDGNLKFADYIGVRPWAQNPFTNDKGWNIDEDRLKSTAKEIVSHLQKDGRFPVAVSRSNCITKEDELCFDILRDGWPSVGDVEKSIMKSTSEVLRDYMFLGVELAGSLITKNPNIIAEQISGDIVVAETGTWTLEIPDAIRIVEEMCNEALAEKYGSCPPEKIRERLNKELGYIQKSGFASYYLIASKMANKCNEMGYLHTLRGCGGGSFVAYLLEITETNPLPPHYYCPSCGKVEFVDEKEFPSGYDLLYIQKNRICPECGASRNGDGQNIPCEFFMGYNGDKLPDFDFNFSEEVYQNCLDETFGSDKVFHAGTMATVSDRLAQDRLNTYCVDKGIHLDPGQRNSLVGRLNKVFRDTGRLPGGFVIVPKDKDIYDFCPLGFARKGEMIEGKKPATQIEYHRLSLEKIDVLCHTMLTSLKKMEIYSGVPAKDIDISQIDISSFFANDSLTGFPFKTEFLKNVLEVVEPTTYSELLKILGFCQGTDVWQENAADLIRQGHDVADTIAFREDVMLYLLEHGVEHKHAFSIAEKVRKGRAAFEGALNEEEEIDLKEHDIPAWYIRSMKKIRYLFPKSHSEGYLKNYLRMVWYKLYYPAAFYAVALSSNEVTMDYGILTEGASRIEKEIYVLQPELEFELMNDQFDADREKRKLLEVLRIGVECYDNGIVFLPADVNKSDPELFTVENGAIRIPFNFSRRLSEEKCEILCKERITKPFSNKEDLRERIGLTDEDITDLQDNHALDSLNGVNGGKF